MTSIPWSGFERSYQFCRTGPWLMPSRSRSAHAPMGPMPGAWLGMSKLATARADKVHGPGYLTGSRNSEVHARVIPQGERTSGMEFYKLAAGAEFEFQGLRFRKLAMSMAEHEDRIGTVIGAATEVTPIGEPLLLPPAEAERWKPSEIPWTDYIKPAPGQG